jgi:hypothetical protein
MNENPVQYEAPFLREGKLLRSVAYGGEKRADNLKSGLHSRSFGVQAGDGESGWAGMGGLFADCIQRQRAAGDGPGVFFRNRQAGKQAALPAHLHPGAPGSVHHRYRPCHPNPQPLHPLFPCHPPGEPR